MVAKHPSTLDSENYTKFRTRNMCGNDQYSNQFHLYDRKNEFKFLWHCFMMHDSADTSPQINDFASALRLDANFIITDVEKSIACLSKITRAKALAADIDFIMRSFPVRNLLSGILSHRSVGNEFPNTVIADLHFKEYRTHGAIEIDGHKQYVPSLHIRHTL